MEWRHQVSREWLEARKKCLTATDVVKLIPAYKRWKRKQEAYCEWVDAGKPKKKVTPTCPEFILPEAAAIYAEKISDTPLNVEAPSSAAARGHILEPYALKDWWFSGNKIYHWDDCIIMREHPILGLGFSPDGCSMQQESNSVSYIYKSGWITSKEESIEAPTKIVEVKSYGANKHMKKIFEKPSEHEEIWQLATAMAVCPEIDEAALLFYNPSLSIGSAEYHLYNKKDMIPYINDVKELYHMAIETIKQLPIICISRKAEISEQEIYDEWLEEYKLDHDLIHG